jgi:hypothetical protein
MNKLSTERRAQVIRPLVEGNSIRSTVRITGVSKNTIAKLFVDVGEACARHHSEIRSFCYAKQKNVPLEKQGRFGYGNVWTWTAIDADSKLCVSWLVGTREAETALEFMEDVAHRATC